MATFTLIPLADIEVIVPLVDDYKIKADGSIWLSIKLPSEFTLDVEKIKSIFEDDVTLELKRVGVGHIEWIKGTIDKPMIAKFFKEELEKRQSGW